MSRPTINTVCANTVQKLKKLDKKLISYEDISYALNLSKPSVDRYVHEPGYITKRGYLSRVLGGWELTSQSKTVGVIAVTITPNNNGMIEEVEQTINEAVSKYGKVVTVKTED